MAAWIDNVVKFLKEIESNGYMWTLEGYNNAKLSAISLFSKCATIFENHGSFKRSPLNTAIMHYRHPDIGFFIDGTNSRDDIIAESRQALSGLLNNGITDLPPVNMSVFYKNPDSLYFMNDVIWNNPWNAGAQLSHYLFFLHARNDTHGIDAVLEKLKRYQKTDGWYNLRPADNVRINGIMKIFTGLDVIGFDYSKISDIIKNITDSMLDTEPEAGGCNIYDYVYVLAKSVEMGYKVDECRDKLHDIYTLILTYQHEDGGFSYKRNSTTTHIYGKLITRGLPVGGIHGTTLMCVALAIIDKACEFGLGLKVPVT